MRKAANAAAKGPLTLDGSHGEGGGQILRTGLSLAAITGRQLEFANIRSGRPKPGLAAQHLTAVRAAGALCDARIEGDELGSTTLSFVPARPVRAGEYTFDVAEARQGGSAGAATLVLQTVLPPLAIVAGRSRVVVHGGTHIPWSPSADYGRDVWLPAFAAMGVTATLDVVRSGWFPVGQGEIAATIRGCGGALAPFVLLSRGALRRVVGRALAANLPTDIPRRMADRAREVLAEAGLESDIDAESVSAACPGAGIFLTAIYEHARAGFGSVGKRGKPAEAVAEEAVAACLAFARSGAAVDAHLGDQLVLPAALADGVSRYVVERVTRHLETNAWVVEQFGLARIAVDGTEGGAATVTITPAVGDPFGD